MVVASTQTVNISFINYPGYSSCVLGPVQKLKFCICPINNSSKFNCISCIFLSISTSHCRRLTANFDVQNRTANLLRFQNNKINTLKQQCITRNLIQLRVFPSSVTLLFKNRLGYTAVKCLQNSPLCVSLYSFQVCKTGILLSSEVKCY